MRELLLSTSLKFVRTHGWNSSAVAAAAESLNLSKSFAGFVGQESREEGGDVDSDKDNDTYFENPEQVLLSYFVESKNKQLADTFSKQQQQQQQQQLAGSPRENLIKVMEKRIELVVPDADIWEAGLYRLARPHNVGLAALLLARTADDICFYADHHQDTDFNYYTKRAMVGAVYAKTELTMLQQMRYRQRGSRNAAKTIQFVSDKNDWKKELRSNMDNAISLDRAIKQTGFQLQTVLNSIPYAFTSSAFGGIFSGFGGDRSGNNDSNNGGSNNGNNTTDGSDQHIDPKEQQQNQQQEQSPTSININIVTDTNDSKNKS